MLHLCKLSVGAGDFKQLRARQAGATTPSHQTRNFPRRAAELLAGGSMYWVISGVMSVRQRIIDIRAEHGDDGSPCARLVFAPDLVPVIGRRLRPFQGWRYLEERDAPPDLGAVTEAVGEAALPEAMRRDLRALCLL